MRLESDQFTALVESFFKEGRAVTVRARGGSMAPAIRDGATIRIAPVAPRAVRPGDVVLFRKPGSGTILHRVALIFKKGGLRQIQTWGDNVGRPDPPVSFSAVLGKAVGCEGPDGWQPLESGAGSYFRHFIRRYGPYYARRLGRMAFHIIYSR